MYPRNKANGNSQKKDNKLRCINANRKDEIKIACLSSTSLDKPPIKKPL